jgi:ATP/maltotriose-dependent transcriptional regulator MalT/DNA-binding SARP family transcriptional activator
MAHGIPGYVRRERLIAPLRATRLALLEAGAGFGKSVLAEQLREALGIASVYVHLGPADADPALLIGSLRRSLRVAGQSDLLAATETYTPERWMERLLDAIADRPEPLLLIFDDAHHLRSAEAAALIVRLAQGLAPPHRLLIATRSLTGPLGAIWPAGDATALDSAALAFTIAEAGELIRSRVGFELDGQELLDMVESTQGWATALVLAASAYEGGPAGRPVRGPGGLDLIASPVSAILEGLSAGDQSALIQLAHLPFVSTGLVCELVGDSDAFDRLVSLAVPLVHTFAGRWELPGPVAEHLASLEPVREATLLGAAEAYGRQGDPLGAITLLLSAGHHEQAAAYLGSMLPHRVEELGVDVVADIVQRLPERAVAAHPSVLLHLARVAETAHQGELRAATLQRAVELPGARADAAFGRELDAERARDLMWDERTRKAARELAQTVVADTAADELVAQARALDVLGRLGSWFSGGEPQPEAESLLERSAALARRIGHQTWAAQALLPLAMGVHFALCRYDRALAVLDEALDLTARNRYRAMVQSFRAELLIELGRFDEAQACLAEMRELGRWRREKWILAYASWGEANLASYRGERARTVQAVIDVDRHRDDWYGQQSGVEFLAQAADYLDRVGEHERAGERLAAARERMAGSEHHVLVYGTAVLARSGDPEAAEESIVELLANGELEPQERWPLVLLRAYAALRRGDDDAGRLAAQAFDTCLELGHPDGPLLRERTVAEMLLPIAAAAGSSAAAALLEGRGGVAIRVLGGFELRRAGRIVEALPGRLGIAVRAVAVAGGRMPSDELIELLWPEVEANTGRNRLRNLLPRVRSAAGDVLVRDGGVISVVPGAEIDAGAFARVARAALSASSAGEQRRAVILARAALERYGGELLPDERYEPWTEAPRERLRLLYLELLDLLAATAERERDLDEAIRLIERAIEAQPYDEERYQRLARLLAAAGRTGSARAVLSQARGVVGPAGESFSAG